nr:hypothetical protein [uncultured Shinella sp.]
MSCSNRRDRGALVALGLALIAVVAVAWLNQPSDQHIAEPATVPEKQYQEQRGPSEGYWWPEFAARDTYAQWAMTILALAATGVSIWAVQMVRATLDATRDGIREAKVSADAALNQALDLQFQQQRPYVHFDGGSFRISISDESKFSCHAEIRIKNSGVSPGTITLWGLFLNSFTNLSEHRGQHSTERSRMIIGREGTDVLTIGTTDGEILPDAAGSFVVSMYVCLKVLYGNIGDGQKLDEETWLGASARLNLGETVEGSHWVVIPEPDLTRFGVSDFSRQWVDADGWSSVRARD